MGLGLSNEPWLPDRRLHDLITVSFQYYCAKLLRLSRCLVLPKVQTENAADLHGGFIPNK